MPSKILVSTIYCCVQSILEVWIYIVKTFSFFLAQCLHRSDI